ncbi:MAG: hypothetical protein L6N94_06415, partial [Candidatus Methylarchaceae archaeon HK01M]|nr:hypothetical protein [Candidatus Methylarchaceae archaeon HK01M]
MIDRVRYLPHKDFRNLHFFPAMVIGHTIPKDVFGKIFVTDDVLSKITYDIRPNSHELYEKFNAYIKQEGF